MTLSSKQPRLSRTENSSEFPGSGNRLGFTLAVVAVVLGVVPELLWMVCHRHPKNLAMSGIVGKVEV